MSKRSTLILDTECLPDYFLICVLDQHDETHFIEVRGEQQRISYDDRERLKALFMSHDRVVTFNGNGYDLPLIKALLQNRNTQELHRLSTEIIDLGQVAAKAPRLKLSAAIEHVDLAKHVPVGVSLKSAGLRLGSKNIKDLPVSPETSVSNDDKLVKELRDYCRNDCLITKDLLEYCLDGIAIRKQLAQLASNTKPAETLNLRESQFAEWLFEKSLQKAWQEKKQQRARSTPPSSVHWEPQRWLKPKSGELRALIDELKSAPYEISTIGKWKQSKTQKRAFTLGNTAYQIGVGGGHSILGATEQGIFTTNEREKVFHLDVVSFYPRLILRTEREPIKGFKQVYKGLLDARVSAKREGRKRDDHALKIGVNGTFGKLNSIDSPLYDPALFLQVTITGQILVMDLAYRLEQAGAKLLQTNTDGVYLRCDHADEANVMAAAKAWSEQYEMPLDHDVYKCFAQRDVNAYVGVKENGEIKAGGGMYRDQPSAPLRWQPRAEIVGQAIRRYVAEGIDPAETINQCDDVGMFVLGTKLSEPCFQDGRPVGQAVRWVRGDGSTLWRQDAKGEVKAVPDSEGAVLALELSDQLLERVDTSWYINKSHELLRDLGVHSVDKFVDRGQTSLFCDDMGNGW